MRLIILLVFVAVGLAFAGPSWALVIVPTFDLNPGSDPNSLNNTSNAAAEVAAINTAITTIEGLYSNPGTVQVLFNFNSGVFGQTNANANPIPYAQYTAQLAAVWAASPANVVLAAAVANLAKGNTADYVIGTTAFLRVGLGFTGAIAAPTLTDGTIAGNFDGIVSMGNLSTSPGGTGQNSVAVQVMEHELNEVLGGGGAGTTIGMDLTPYLCPDSPACGSSVIGPTDPYRYQSTGPTCANVGNTPSFTTNANTVACYSIDGGNTAIVQMNQAGGGSDFGDFANTTPNTPYIQDAFYPGASDVYSTLSPEFTMMQSIGYDAYVPEPATFVLFTGAVGGLGWLHRRRAGRAFRGGDSTRRARLTPVIPTL